MKVSDRRYAVHIGLLAGILVVSTAAILIRTAQSEGATSLTIAAVRLLLASCVLIPIAWWRAGDELRKLRGRDWAWTIASGVCLAVHFGAWITSLEHTSVASSTALVTTNPIWVGLASVLLLRELPTKAILAGLVCALAGTILLFAADARVQTAAPDSLMGNTLALLGAITASAYLIIGRMLRDRISLMTYVSIVYGAAALVLVASAAARGQAFLGLSTTAYLCMAALALGPQLFGHTLINWSLRRVSATLVALSILGEPIGSSLLAWWILGEQFGAIQLVGFALILTGIYLAARGARSEETQE